MAKDEVNSSNIVDIIEKCGEILQEQSVPTEDRYILTPAPNPPRMRMKHRLWKKLFKKNSTFWALYTPINKKSWRAQKAEWDKIKERD